MTHHEANSAQNAEVRGRADALTGTPLRALRRWESFVAVREDPDGPNQREIHVAWHLTERAAVRSANRVVRSPLVTASAMFERLFACAEVRRAS